MCEKAVFDFEGVDVFASADDEIFDPAGDFQIAVCVYEGFVAGLCVSG